MPKPKKKPTRKSLRKNELVHVSGMILDYDKDGEIKSIRQARAFPSQAWTRIRLADYNETGRIRHSTDYTQLNSEALPPDKKLIDLPYA